MAGMEDGSDRMSPGGSLGWTGLALVSVLAFCLLASLADAGTIFFFKDENGVSHFSNVRLSDRYKPLYQFKDPPPRPGSNPGAPLAHGSVMNLVLPGVRDARSFVSPAEKEEIRGIIRQISPRHGLDPILVQAVVEVESNYFPLAVSPQGAQGLMQIMPVTQRDLGLTAPFDPRSNVDAGIRYLKFLLQKFGSVRLALAAYNAGPGEVERHSGVPPFPETQDYVTKVISKYLRYKFIQ